MFLKRMEGLARCPLLKVVTGHLSVTGALWQVRTGRSIATNPPTSARENTINCPDAHGLLLDVTPDENPSLANFHRISDSNARP